MIERGRPVFGICRGFQEINVLFGGTLSPERCGGRHLRGSWDDGYDALFGRRHDVLLFDGGFLARCSGSAGATVTSVHEQGVDRLGSGLSVEAGAAEDGLVEAISARPCGGDVLAVQWHSECDVDRSTVSRAFFAALGSALRGQPPTVSPRRRST